MIQFYFFSVLFNLATGLALCQSSLRKEGPAIQAFAAFLGDSTVRLILGILTAVTGALKLVFVMSGDFPVVGDFLPAAAGIVSGACLLAELHGSGRLALGEDSGLGNSVGEATVEPSTVKEGSPLPSALVSYSTPIGIAGLIAAALHLLFANVILL